MECPAGCAAQVLLKPSNRLMKPTGSARNIVSAWWLVILLAGCVSRPASRGPVMVLPESVRTSFHLAPSYQKYLPVGGLPVVGSSQVSDHAMREAAWLVERLLGGRPDILQAMAANQTRFAVMAWNEFTTDIPEHAALTPKVFWDRRARGLGATPQAPAVSCAEENLLAFPGDPYPTENIGIHEFAHAIHEMGLGTVDPTFDPRLRAAFHSATNRGLWAGTYAGSNRHEYWAEAVQSWFDDNRQNDALHNHVNTRAELKSYDPGVAALCLEVFGDGAWRYRRPMLRPARDRRHLAGFDPARSPRFEWRPAPVPDQPRVLIQTALGDLELELDARRAPETTRNFLRYVHAGLYSDGQFFRTVRSDNQPTNAYRIQVIQAGANPARTNDFYPAIRLERTRDTGWTHRAGTLSMARSEPDTAQENFFICLEDAPELDYGGRRNADGQGFAAFGMVVQGMNVLREMHRQPATGQTLSPPIRIQRAIRLN